MQLNKWDFDTSFDFTKTKRACANPSIFTLIREERRGEERRGEQRREEERRSE